MNELFLTVVLEQVEAATANAILEAKLLSISLISFFSLSNVPHFWLNCLHDYRIYSIVFLVRQFWAWGPSLMPKNRNDRKT